MAPLFLLKNILAMKIKILSFLFFISISCFAQQQTVISTVTPAVFDETTSITVTINGNSINEASWGVTNNVLYMWAWAFELDGVTQKVTPINGDWNNSNESTKFNYNAGSDTYTKTFVPSTYFNTTGIGKIGFLIKAKDGTGDKNRKIF